jgi:AcrR family transcriptional regulator
MIKRQRNQRGEGARLKDEIIEAAMRLLDQRPAAELSLRTVAREAGITPPSVYAHFPDARAMTTAVVRECWRQVGEAMEEAAAALDPAATPFEQLLAKIEAYVRYAMERPSRYQLLFAIRPIDPVEPPDVDGLLAPAHFSVLQSITDFAAAGGRLPTTGAFSSTVMTLSLVHGRIAIAHLGPLRGGNSADGIATFMRATLAQIFDQKERT